jgi:transcriptional regulator with XRE-family HTH domain
VYNEICGKKGKNMAAKFDKVKYNINNLETGKRIRELRKKHKIKITELSRKTGISKAMISEIETGKHKPSPNLMFALIKLFNVNVNWLLTGEGDIYQKKGETAKKSVTEDEFNDLYYDMLWHLENTPVVRYSVMGFFSEYMHKYKKLNKSEKKSI